MNSILHILKLNEPRSGIGRVSQLPYNMQDAECIICADDGTPVEVGVLSIPDDLRGKVQPGVFIGSFALRASKAKDGGRKIGAVLIGLQPYVIKGAASGAKA